MSIGGVIVEVPGAGEVITREDVRDELEEVEEALISSMLGIAFAADPVRGRE